MSCIPESVFLRNAALALLLLAQAAGAADAPFSTQLDIIQELGAPAVDRPAVDAGADVLPPLPNEACMAQVVEDPRWYDRAQGYFSQRACTPATWFDRFFGGDRTGDVASALVRVIPSIQYSDRDFTDAGVRVQARVHLPNLRDRMSLVVNDDADERAGLLQGETQRPSLANSPGRESSAALRYIIDIADDAKEDLHSRADIDVGLRGEVKFFTRARYYHTWQHSPLLDSRFTQTLFFLDGEGFGETSRFEMERMLAEDTLFRWSTQATISDALDGVELRDGIQVLHQIDRNRAVSWNLATTINSEPAWKANAYGTSVRYRQRILRPWLFIEVEPFVDAIRLDNFRANPGIAFRMEWWLGDDAGSNNGIREIARGHTMTDTGPAFEVAPVEEMGPPENDMPPVLENADGAELPAAAPSVPAATPVRTPDALTSPAAAPAAAPAASQ